MFDTFRSDGAYREILEHVTRSLARDYIEFVGLHTPHMLGLLDRFRAADAIGGPRVHDFGRGIGVFAPSTWRYIKVLADLAMMFGDLGGLRIVEVGGGYGGQCAAIAALYPFESYTIIDLPEAGALQRRFLGRLGVNGVRFLRPDQVPESLGSDLFVSNYALSELSRELALDTIRRCCVASDRGYVIANQLSDRCLGRVEMTASLRGAMVFPEVPLTHARNYLVAWRRDSAAFKPDPWRQSETTGSR